MTTAKKFILAALLLALGVAFSFATAYVNRCVPEELWWQGAAEMWCFLAAFTSSVASIFTIISIVTDMEYRQ